MSSETPLRPCPECDGKGYDGDTDCPLCSGTGRTETPIRRPLTSKPERTGNWFWDWGYVLIGVCVLVAILLAATVVGR